MTREVVSVSMDTTLREVRARFAQRRFHHLIVTEHQRVVGILSDRDLLANLSPFIDGPNARTVDLACLNRHVHQIMSRKVIVGTPAMSVEVAAGLLMHHQISALPVVDEHGRCVGIVSWRDLLRVAYPQSTTDQRVHDPANVRHAA